MIYSAWTKSAAMSGIGCMLLSGCVNVKISDLKDEAEELKFCTGKQWDDVANAAYPKAETTLKALQTTWCTVPPREEPLDAEIRANDKRLSILTALRQRPSEDARLLVHKARYELEGGQARTDRAKARQIFHAHLANSAIAKDIDRKIAQIRHQSGDVRLDVDLTRSDIDAFHKHLKDIMFTKQRAMREKQQDLSLTGGVPKSPEDVIADEQDKLCKQLIADGATLSGKSVDETECRNDKAVRQHVRRTVFIEEYLHAYFLHGHVFAVDKDEIVKELQARLPKKLSDLKVEQGADPAKNAVRQAMIAEVNKEVAQLNEQLTKASAHIETEVTRLFRDYKDKLKADENFSIYSADKEPGYVGRLGDILRFQSLKLDTQTRENPLSPTRFDYAALAGDVIAIYIEAIRDADETLPAVSGATALRLGAQEFVEKEKFDKPRFERSIAQVDKTVAFTMAGTAQLLESGIFSPAILTGTKYLGPMFKVDTDGLSHIIERTLGTMVKKHAEKVMWCAEICRRD